MHVSSRWLGSAALFVAAALLLASGGIAQDKQAPKVTDKHDATDLSAALKDVINVGAELFNKQADHAGCYRVYQGALISVKPFLTPELQKKVDAGIAKAEALPFYADRAFELRGIIDEIRTHAKRGKTDDKKASDKKASDKKSDDKKSDNKKSDNKKSDDKKSDDKKAEEKKKDDKKVDEKKADDKKGADKKEEKKPKAGTELSGKVTLNGQPLPAGNFVTIVANDGRKYSTAVQKDGSFRFGMPVPAAAYRVAIEAAPSEGAKTPIPERYRSEKTSSLVVEVQGGKQTLDLNLTSR